MNVIMRCPFPNAQHWQIVLWRVVSIGCLFAILLNPHCAFIYMYIFLKRLLSVNVFVVAGWCNLGLCASDAVNDQSHSFGRKGVLRLRLLGKEPQLLWEKPLNMSPLFCCIYSPCCPKQSRLKVLKTQFSSPAPNWTESCSLHPV